VILTAPLGYRLANQLREGQIRPYTLPISQSVGQAIKERVHQEYGVTFISAARFGAKSDTDVVIIVSSAKPVSVNLISDLKQLVNDEMGENVHVAVHTLKEAGVKKSRF
jgi:predicted nucleotidyltransferase